jgi:hypothetical protein
VALSFIAGLAVAGVLAAGAVLGMLTLRGSAGTAESVDPTRAVVAGDPVPVASPEPVAEPAAPVPSGVTPPVPADPLATGADGVPAATPEPASVPDPDFVAQPKTPPELEARILEEVLALTEGDLGEPKLRDLYPDGPMVTMYQDEGWASPNRVKIDRDRDGVYDERWAIKNGIVLRRVSPDDNEDYSQAWVLKDGEWRDSRKHTQKR